MSNLNDFQSGIKSIQRGSQTMDATSKAVTITAVVMAQSMVLVSCMAGDSTVSGAFASGVLTNTTTLTLEMGYRGATTVVKWQVIEFQPLYFGARIKSLQRGETDMPDDGTSNTATIDAVVMAKSILNVSMRGTALMLAFLQASSELTDTTTITFTSDDFCVGRYATIVWEVIEFY